MSIALKIAKEITQNDTFKAGVTVTRTVAGITAPVNLTGVTITSQVRQMDGTLVADCTINSIDLVNGQIQVRAESNTSQLVGTPPWPVEVFKWDIQFVEAGDTWSMPVRGISVTEDNTA